MAQPGREALGRSRGGLSTKIHLAADRRCRPVTQILTPGQHGDCPIWSPGGGASAQRQRLGPVIGPIEVRAAARRVWQRSHSLPYRQSIARLSGLGSQVRMTRMLAEEAFLGERHQPAADTAVPVRVRELGGNVAWLRPRSTDRLALEFVGYGHHLPPAGLTGPVRHIAVFGANIGLLTADLAGRYPHARLLGVEADHDNALLARRNLARLGGRCTLEETAVWYRDETLTLNWEPDAWGQIVVGPVSGNGSAATVRHLDAVDAANLLAAFTGPAPVDYLLVNIESAWYEMLRHGRWTANVDCIKVEITDHYDEAVPLLESLGYRAHLHRLDWGAFAIGIRPAEQSSGLRPQSGSRSARPARAIGHGCVSFGVSLLGPDAAGVMLRFAVLVGVQGAPSCYIPVRRPRTTAPGFTRTGSERRGRVCRVMASGGRGARPASSRTGRHRCALTANPI